MTFIKAIIMKVSHRILSQISYSYNTLRISLFMLTVSCYEYYRNLLESGEFQRDNGAEGLENVAIAGTGGERLQTFTLQLAK